MSKTIKLFNQGKSTIQYAAGADFKPNETIAFSEADAAKLIRLYPNEFINIDKIAGNEDAQKDLEKERAVIAAELKLAKNELATERENLEVARQELNEKIEAFEKEVAAFAAKKTTKK